MGFATWGRALGHPAPTAMGAFKAAIVIWLLFPFPVLWAALVGSFRRIGWTATLALFVWFVPTFWLWYRP